MMFVVGIAKPAAGDGIICLVRHSVLGLKQLRIATPGAKARTEGRTILTTHPPFQQHVKAIRQFVVFGPMAFR